MRLVRTPLSAIPQLYRNVRRLTEILSVLSKYGLADWVSHLNVDFLDARLKTRDGDIISHLSHPARVRMAFTELGPTFIKLGQFLSTRPDIVGVPLADELSNLQSNVPADPTETVQATIESEMQRPLAQLFMHFQAEPIAVASIGQVHRATLPDGSEVAVKVRRVGIEQTIETDLDIIAGLAQLIDKLEDFRAYQPQVFARDMAAVLRSELDFVNEQENMLQFRRMFRQSSRVRIPRPIPGMCSPKMLTMEFLRGIKVSDVNSSLDCDRDLIARSGAQTYLQMIFEHGLFHADPHPGNLLILEDSVIGLLDFGNVGRLSETLRLDMQILLYSIVTDDQTQLARVVRRIGNTPVGLDEQQFMKDLAQFVGRYSTQELAEFQTAAALQDFVRIVREHKVTLPGDVATLVKVLVTLEGTSRLLSPEFNLMQVMRPFLRRMMLQRLSPRRQLRQLARFMLQAERLVESMPNRIETILEQIQSGRFDVHLDHRRLGPSVNRLVMGLVTSALFLGSALVLSFKVPPLLFPQEPWMGMHQLSMMGVLGTIVSFLLGARLVWAIRKSGNLDHND